MFSDTSNKTNEKSFQVRKAHEIKERGDGNGYENNINNKPRIFPKNEIRKNPDSLYSQN